MLQRRGVEADLERHLRNPLKPLLEPQLLRDLEADPRAAKTRALPKDEKVEVLQMERAEAGRREGKKKRNMFLKNLQRRSSKC